MWEHAKPISRLARELHYSDGSEDPMIASDAKEFWDRLAMQEKINSSVAEFEHTYENVVPAWNFENVQNEIIPYPKRKELDEMVWGNYGR